SHALGGQMTWVTSWVHAFLITMTIELLVGVPLLGKSRPGAAPDPLWRRAGAVVFAQLASHPLVWFVLPELHLRRSNYALVAETWAVVSELVLYRLVFVDLSWSRVLGVSALANGVSFAVGTFLN
ncbi:MAG TPA: hypothetical protein VFQ61_06840, partial [Polyangiaceae bacterium]|nr:hypothetical protein [Polyangiaceae bacterium]